MQSSPNTDQILKCVDDICSHQVFSRSPKLCDFLIYITHESLDGRASRICAYSVAVDALKKPNSFDPQNDATVRVHAKRLRDSLRRYYEQETEVEVIVILHPGSYAPHFIFASDFFTSPPHSIAHRNAPECQYQ